MKDRSLWPEVLPRIQAILNNTSSLTTGKTPNKIAHSFSLQRPLDLLSNSLLPNTFQAGADAANVISFALANQKAHYDLKHQPFFMKVGDWAMLKLHKGYSIPFFAGVTKKLTQQYVRLFRVLEKLGRLAYKLDVPLDWKLYPVFWVAKLKPAPSPTDDPFNCPRPHMPPAMFVDGDTNTSKSFEVERLLNK